MKRIFLAILAVSTLYSCKDDTQKEKDLLNDILKVHDKVMSSDEALMKNKMKLDTLLKHNVDTIQVRALDDKLSAADAAMENWMSKFQPDMTGKSHDEVMKYYDNQKKQVMAIDSQISAAVKESNTYLSTSKTK